MKKLIAHILAAPETNLFLFAFLMHFVYEVWQSPYFDFYAMPSLSDKVNYITHCTVGDGVITVISGWAISGLYRSRQWMLSPTWKSIVLFTALGWMYTFISEIYRVHIAKLYGVSVLLVPVFNISWLPLLQWIILPPLVLYMAKHQMLGYQSK
ncbi:hypothetical protein Syn7502_01509 [Synechococcus sp. PCC 7502]|uniref:hypothetical protein n=1 Tax=Synechococcus sp. PCC 7502 TaxID=1173263 RepID=UPI00029FCA7E|nr:hypothetical protein [Synechococcus sp. PCC 7502]AFY73577.1 hypothetical protein Syn7502_01509 [Synechococcus sp. PCC 7502]